MSCGGPEEVLEGAEKGSIRGRKKGSFGKGSFQKRLFSRDSRESRDSRDPSECGKKGESNHFLEILENLEILEIPRDASSEKSPFVMTP